MAACGGFLRPDEEKQGPSLAQSTACHRDHNGFARVVQSLVFHGISASHYGKSASLLEGEAFEFPVKPGQSASANIISVTVKAPLSEDSLQETDLAKASP